MFFILWVLLFSAVLEVFQVIVEFSRICVCCALFSYVFSMHMIFFSYWLFWVCSLFSSFFV